MTTEARLRAFVAVAETGSVRAAAQRLVVTESAVSAAVAALTRDVGAPLLERQGRGLRLTAAGLTYAGYARTILGLHAEALAAVRGEADSSRGQVRLAAVTTAGEHVLPTVLASFRAEHPGIELGLEVGTREHVWGLLATHEADLVIAGRAPAALGAVVRAVRRNALIVVGSPRVAAGFDLERTTWLMRETGSGTRETCEALLASLDVEPPTLTLGSNGAVVSRRGGRTGRDPGVGGRRPRTARRRGPGAGPGAAHTHAAAVARGYQPAGHRGDRGARRTPAGAGGTAGGALASPGAAPRPWCPAAGKAGSNVLVSPGRLGRAG